MKPVLFQLFSLLCYNIIFSQNTRFNKHDDSLITNAVYIQYNLEGFDKSTLPAKLPFSKITFFDVRYDTSFIAINWQSNSRPGLGKYIQNRKFNLENGIVEAFGNYFNFYFADNFSGDGEMICYIKKFSLALKDTMINYAKADESYNTVKFEVDCYYKKSDSLYPAIRIDTSYTRLTSKLRKTFSDLTKEIFQPLLEKLSITDTSKIFKRKSYTDRQISDKYQSRFNLPILTATEYKKGVYKSFKEFINNEPSITVFSIKKTNNKVELYDANGDIISKAFGFCDGENCWRFGGSFCSKLIRVGNGFEYFFTVYIVGDLMTSTKKYLLSLNMETGRVD